MRSSPSSLSTRPAGEGARHGPGTVVDVGGGRGALLAVVLQRQPDLSGLLCDLPEVIAAAPAYLAEAGVADRVEVVSGSFFDGAYCWHSVSSP